MELKKGNQISAARALLGWDQKDLAERVGVSVAAISKIEKGDNKGKSTTLEKIDSAFEAMDVELTKDGVRFKNNGVRILEGKSGYIEFFEDVYWTLRESKIKTVYVESVDERQFDEFGLSVFQKHRQRMLDLGIRFKILVKYGDTYLPATDYAEYRWTPENTFYSVPYYMYGGKLAMMIFGKSPRVYILNEPEITSIHRTQFESLWKQSKHPVIKG